MLYEYLKYFTNISSVNYLRTLSFTQNLKKSVQQLFSFVIKIYTVTDNAVFGHFFGGRNY